MFQCPAEEHRYFCPSLIFPLATNALNEWHMQNAHRKIMFSPACGQEISRHSGMSLRTLISPRITLKQESPGHTNYGKQTQTLNAGEKKRRNYVIMAQSPNPSRHFSRENFPWWWWWWLPRAMCSGVIGALAVLDNQFMKGNAMSLLVFMSASRP